MVPAVPPVQKSLQVHNVMEMVTAELVCGFETFLNNIIYKVRLFNISVSSSL